MALCSTLPVYIATVNYISEVIDVQKQFPRDIKHTLGQAWLINSINLPTYIIHANMFRSEREKWLSEFICQFEFSKMVVRMAIDKHWVSNHQVSKLVYLESSIGKQITAWKNSPKKNQIRRRNRVNDETE